MAITIPLVPTSGERMTVYKVGSIPTVRTARNTASYMNPEVPQMSTTTTLPVVSLDEMIDAIADRTAAREVDALHDYYLLGRRIVEGAEYKPVQTAMLAAFKVRNLAASTVKVYMSQGYGLAALFDTFEALTDWADDECGGSRSLKRLYDTVRKAGKDDEAEGGEGGEGEGEAVATVTTDADRAAAILAILGSMTDASAIASVRDAAVAMLTPAAVAV